MSSHSECLFLLLLPPLGRWVVQALPDVWNALQCMHCTEILNTVNSDNNGMAIVCQMGTMLM